MADIRMNVRCSEELKEAFGVFCEAQKKDPSEVLRLFVDKTAEIDGIPAIFTMQDFRRSAGRDGDCVVRLFFRVTEDARDKFQAVCKRYNVSMSRMVKMFVMRCLEEGNIPSGMC